MSCARSGSPAGERKGRHARRQENRIERCIASIGTGHPIRLVLPRSCMPFRSRQDEPDRKPRCPGSMQPLRPTCRG